ncbi:MAG TPA: asparagine--tRNA ligase [Candidatus Polarisedimenticolia bacterium]|nr:asparagine--tRNA ligase [Candidatus Polarisedimenticolia bacterium]
MKGHTAIRDLGESAGKEVLVRGWLYAKRESGRIRFLVVRDGTGYLQCVAISKELSPEVFAACGTLGQESSVEVTGTIRNEPRAPGGVEMGLKDVKVLQAAQDYPITPKEHGPEFLLDHRHLWLRSSRPHALLRLRNEVCQGCRDFFYERGFVLIDSPMFTPSACEGTSTLFETDYFGQKAYLTQSGQLYLEPACMAFGKVYCFGPTFRAEKSKTRRHLTEFWMVEPEVAFNDSNDNMRLQERFVSYVVERVLERRGAELKELERNLLPLEQVKPPFARISYTDAINRLNGLGSDITWGSDLGGDDETLLAKQYDRPVFVFNYPKQVKAFYMKENPEDPRTVLNNDCLAPEGYGEIIGGSQREDDHDRLLARIREQGLDPEAYRWYLDLRKYGTFVHSGFGLGVERTVAWICGLPHIREAIAFPRQIHRLYP